MAYAAAFVLTSTPCVILGAPVTCAQVVAKIEKRLAATGVEHPPLKIVPKNLATGARVLSSCEGGTQRIVYGSGPAASTAGSDHATAKPAPPPAKR